MKITITRSFSKKSQLKQFEPIDIFCSAQWESEIVDRTTDETREGMAANSKILDEFCRAEVDKTLAIFRPLKEQGKSPGERKEDAMASAQHDAGSSAPGNWRPV
jgi:hypothetical protein